MRQAARVTQHALASELSFHGVLIVIVADIEHYRQAHRYKQLLDRARAIFPEDTSMV